MSVIELHDVKYVYQSKYQRVEALRGISYNFQPGKVYAIMGSSGCGKTTLLSLMAGLDVPTEGKVLCEGISTGDIDLEKYRRERVAVIYQDFRKAFVIHLNRQPDHSYTRRLRTPASVVEHQYRQTRMIGKASLEH